MKIEYFLYIVVVSLYSIQILLLYPISIERLFRQTLQRSLLLSGLALFSYRVA